MIIKGKTADGQIKRLYNIKAKQLALAAKPIIKEQVRSASSKIAALVKDKAIDADTHAVYIEEKDLQYPGIKGNQKPKPVSSNTLLLWLDKGTPSHTIKPVNAVYLHFQKNGSDIFTKKTINHPGTKAQNVWNFTGTGNSNNAIKEVDKLVSEKVSAIFA